MTGDRQMADRPLFRRGVPSPARTARPEFAGFRSARPLVNKHVRWQDDLSAGYFVLTLGGCGARAVRARPGEPARGSG